MDKIFVNTKCSICGRKLTMQMDKEEYQEYIEFIEDNGEYKTICGVCEESGYAGGEDD